MEVDELIRAGKLDDAERALRSVNRHELNDIELLDYSHDVVALGLGFLKRDGLEKATSTVLSLLDELEDILWGIGRIFKEYLRECTPERVRKVRDMIYLIPEPEKKVDVLLDVYECLENTPEGIKVLREAFAWALRVKGRSMRTYMISRVLNRVHDVGDYDLMLELCRRIKEGERRSVFEDFLFENESAKTCEELIDILRRRSEDADVIDVVIQAHKENEKELLRSRGLNPRVYKLVPRRTEEGVTFYAVPVPLYPLVLLLWRIQGFLRERKKRT